MPINEKLITPEVLNNTLRKEIYPEVKVIALPKKGKVRSIYDIGNNQLLMMSSDDLSTHDVVHKRQVYAKGGNLDAISSNCFEKTGHIIPNHFIRDVAPNTWLVRKAERILVEIVFRSYITGSGWRDYVKVNGPEEGAMVSGVSIRPGYRKNEKLDDVIFTPAAKGQVKDFLSVPEMQKMVDNAKPEDREKTLNTDDPKLTEETIRNNYKAFGLRKPEDLDYIAEKSFQLFDSISRDLESRGYLLADTKWEFGYFPDGTIGLIDECVTPDSSRIWGKAQYEFNPEKSEFIIVQNDKQPFRDYVEALGLDEDKEALAAHWMADEVLKAGVIRYCNIREKITGTLPEITTTPRKDIILEALGDAGYLR
ncbi:MAG: phosphoribosylaminoimidazolesuccinocarboxamide synthase [Candidatus Woesearchaeota archaeon]|jgi:phosphoribosylaminoimidazole-succinocarboxamide synthase|nr:phosphoribosylaminoimidazolesuccinocarboxamide synthase [Candidatus Woesearchaeota archaeon]MDP7506140.1 phosphoribosylaminoimidazolesuccinocarboxamide synthase [Candidatus Woesearchaeota archaeon]|tara:strand:- start:2207 stop:3304 length:1098 start_codon:yes stop_codon:yes gene_type:complete